MKLLQEVSIYYLVIIFLIILSIFGTFTFGFNAVLRQILPPLLATVLTDSVIKYIKLKNWKISPSAVISGLIIGLVGQFGASLLTLILIGVSSMLIKAFIRLEGRHIFNPAASGLFLGMIFLNSYPSWWAGGSIWPFLFWMPILLFKMKRWSPMLGFLAPATLTLGFNIFTSVSTLFFLSVMLIEPKTSPSNAKLGLLYGLAVGFVLAIFNFQFSMLNSFDPLTISLLIGNLTARILSRYIS